MTVALIVAALLLANAFFVAAEFALVGAPRTSLEHAAARGSSAARAVMALLEDPLRQDRFLATTQIGISLASIALGMYGEHEVALTVEAWLAGWHGPVWLTAHTLAGALALATLTSLHIVIGEVVPKALALQRPAAVIVGIAPAMGAVEAALSPLVRLLSGAGRLVLRLAGIAPAGESADRYHSAEELQFVIEESERSGLLDGESGRVLRELFTFGDLTAERIMVPVGRVASLRAGAAFEDVRLRVRTEPHTRYLVMDGTRVAGSIHIKALLRLLRRGRGVEARDARPVPFLPRAATLDGVLGAMRAHRTQLAVVADEAGAPLGLVTMEDLCEEVLGTIDEAR